MNVLIVLTIQLMVYVASWLLKAVDNSRTQLSPVCFQVLFKIGNNCFRVPVVQPVAKVVYNMQTLILLLQHERDNRFHLQPCQFAHFSLWCSCLAKMPKVVAQQ